MKITEVHNDLQLHKKDYNNVRCDVDGISKWFTWIAKIIIGAVVFSLLALVGLK